LAGCNIMCQYCDTKESFLAPLSARIETQAGSRLFHSAPNPFPITDLVSAVQNLCHSPHHSISLTGGEPLLQPEAVSAVSSLRKTGARIYLETNGTLSGALAQVIDEVDIISMDFKLPSAMRGKSYWQEHAAFLKIASRQEVFVKVVLSGETTQAELEQAIALIGDVDDSIPLILQPVTPINGVSAANADNILRWQGLAMEKLRMVRVIPQTHKILGQL
jgi:7-carboxy-7-deazaguanine synthase